MTCPLFCPGGLCEKERGKCFTESNPSSLDTFNARIIPEWNFFSARYLFGFGCDATTVSDAGIWHDSSSESSEVRVGRVKLISFDDVTTKLGPILRSSR